MTSRNFLRSLNHHPQQTCQVFRREQFADAEQVQGVAADGRPHMFSVDIIQTAFSFSSRKKKSKMKRLFGRPV
jgi:hypothetical protein